MKRVLAFAAVVTALTATAVGFAIPARADANNDNAHACRDGWETLLRADLGTFKNRGDCVSYAARGGTFASPSNEATGAETVCEAVGGEFGGPDSQDLQPLARENQVDWTCNHVPLTDAFNSGDLFIILRPECDDDVFSASQVIGTSEGHATCYLAT